MSKQKKVSDDSAFRNKEGLANVLPRHGAYFSHKDEAFAAFCCLEVLPQPIIIELPFYSAPEIISLAYV